MGSKLTSDDIRQLHVGFSFLVKFFAKDISFGKSYDQKSLSVQTLVRKRGEARRLKKFDKVLSRYIDVCQRCIRRLSATSVDSLGNNSNFDGAMIQGIYSKVLEAYFLMTQSVAYRSALVTDTWKQRGIPTIDELAQVVVRLESISLDLIESVRGMPDPKGVKTEYAKDIDYRTVYVTKYSEEQAGSFFFESMKNLNVSPINRDIVVEFDLVVFKAKLAEVMRKHKIDADKSSDILDFFKNSDGSKLINTASRLPWIKMYLEKEFINLDISESIDIQIRSNTVLVKIRNLGKDRLKSKDQVVEFALAIIDDVVTSTVANHIVKRAK